MTRALLLAVLLLALAGCGDGGGGGLSQEEWAERADAICAEAQEDLAAVEVPGELSEVPAYVEKTLPVAQRELRQLRALEAEEDIRPETTRFVEAVERALDLARRLGEVAGENDLEQARSVGRRAQAAAQEVSRLARELGADTCAEQ